VLRPIPSFSGAASANTDLPDCNHLMGTENTHTGGTVGAFCTCSHPKCLVVIGRTGAERQRMPLEFLTQRIVRMPLTIIYCGINNGSSITSVLRPTVAKQ